MTSLEPSSQAGSTKLEAWSAEHQSKWTLRSLNSLITYVCIYIYIYHVISPDITYLAPTFHASRIAPPSAHWARSLEWVKPLKAIQGDSKMMSSGSLFWWMSPMSSEFAA